MKLNAESMKIQLRTRKSDSQDQSGDKSIEQQWAGCGLDQATLD